MKRYDVIFCSCGTIQTMPTEYYDWLEEDYKNRFILRVCQRCGKVVKVWLSEYEDGFAINATSVENFELTDEAKGNFRILFNKGIQVPLKNGEYADYHTAGVWFSEQGKSEVDTDRLIKEVKDPDILRSIAGYVSGINWKGTSYELY